MRLVRIGESGRERPAVLRDDDMAIFVDDLVEDWGPETVDADALAAFTAADWRDRPPVHVTGMRFGSPLRNTTKIVCIGLNYRAHAEESGMAIPSEPIVFLKAPDCLTGPTDAIYLPPGAECLDYEAELAIVIGRTALRLESPAAVPAHILGYAISQDISERSWQLDRGGQWVKGKSFPSFNPLGPMIVTADSFDRDDATVQCFVDGVRRQDGRTSDMIFGPDYLVWYLSQFMRLLPGDVINTGTPAGVALATAPNGYLRAGQHVETVIPGLGRQSSHVVAHG